MSGLEVAVGFVVFIFSVIVHENAHGLAAERYGDPTARSLGRITMNPVPHIDPVGSVVIPAVAYISGGMLFGWAKPVPVNTANLRNPIVHNSYVAAAGPISNFILALFGALLWAVVGIVFKLAPDLIESNTRTIMFFNALCGDLIRINCILAVFNLMPIPPLDGHWILIRFLPPGPREAIASIGRYGFLVIILLMMTGLLWRIIGPPYLFVVGGYQSLVRAVIGLF